ncbi:MAG: efflux RND transporter permease subunit [Gammaproteobacteria bacterium]|nr:efflux RND transporter permease subunit [Gammaproteobacteria bacterium]
MKLTEMGLRNPTAVGVVMWLILLIGWLSYSRLPVQLTPELQEPEIRIITNWRAATPEEVEAEIVKRQEEALRGIPGVTELVARAQSGRAELNLSFVVGMDIRRALVEVMNRLGQVSGYPDDADEPFVDSTDGASAIAWFIVHALPDNARDVTLYRDYIEDLVKERFERVPGVAVSEVFGGQERELRVSFDPYRLAELGIELPGVSRYVGAGENVSGGFVDIGKREYSLRFAGRYGPGEFGAMILAWRDGRPVYLRDVATVEVRPVDPRNFVIAQGRPSIAVNAQREVGVNVLEVMSGLRQAAADLEEPLRRAGLSMQQVYDETLYIDASIRFLYGNLGLGILLATGILWLFLRNVRATLTVILAIPACLLATFAVLQWSGRTLNVISLAGLAFAVGMVLDASIVVLENIVRLREQGVEGKGRRLLAAFAVGEVWGALLASTATTVIVFLPVIFLESEVGQLFADLALSISAAVCASLFIAIFVVPAAETVWVANRGYSAPRGGHLWDRMTSGIMFVTDRPRWRLLWVAVLIAAPILGTAWLRPSLDYLPEGSRNLAFAYLRPAPGASIEHLRREMGSSLTARLAPHLRGEREPAIKHYFFVGFGGDVFMGAVAREASRLPQLVNEMRGIFRDFPDTFAFVQKTSLFGGREGNSVEVNFQARELEPLLQAASRAFGRIQEELPGVNIRPLPGLILAKPELRLVPDERRLAEAGWTRRELALIVRALGDGLDAGDYFTGEEILDIIVRATPWRTPDEIADIPLATPGGGIVPLKELAQVVRTAGAEEIRRSNQRRTVTLRVNPPPGVSLDTVLEVLRTRVEPDLWPLLPGDAEIQYQGTAEKLQVAVRELGGSFILAVVVLYLLMTALFRSYGYSLLVLVTLPLATVGGVAALRFANLFVFQPLDLLTMIGFIMLLGLVVNNAILLVYRAREAERAGAPRREAVVSAVRTRLRPIMMSTLTSIFGMLPLALLPGAGSEIYRGLAAVIIGGLSVNVIFLLLLVPSLLLLDRRDFRMRRAGV